MNCPKCDVDISDTYEPDDYSCGIQAGWYCDACDHAIGEWEYPREPLEGDVWTGPTSRPANIGTPISEISGQPGPKNDPGHPDHERYAEFLRIAKSWGFD